MTDRRPREYHDGVLYVGDAARRLRRRRPDIPSLTHEMDGVQTMRQSSRDNGDGPTSQVVSIEFVTDPVVSVSLRIKPRETAGGGVIGDGLACVSVDHHRVSNPIRERPRIRIYGVADDLDDEFLSRKLRREAALWLQSNAHEEAKKGWEIYQKLIRDGGGLD